MSVQGRLHQRPTEIMSNTSFRLMSLVFKLIDQLSTCVERRALSFDVHPGMSVVDYGCGPGRYTLRFSWIVGDSGRVYAVDIHELAVKAVEKMKSRFGLRNIQPVLAQGYNSGLPDAIADRIFVLDVFHGIQQPEMFLAEIRRLIKPAGLLIIDNGHQSRDTARRKILDTGLWKVESESKDHMLCRPI